MVGACRIDFFLFSLSLPRRWMRAVLKCQRKEDDRASGTSNEVSARPNTRESDDCEGAVRCEPVGGPLDQSEPTQKAPSLSKLVRTRKFAPAFFLLTAHCAAVGCCAAYGCGIPPAGAARFLFGKTKRKWGVDCQAINIAYIHPIGKLPASAQKKREAHASLFLSALLDASKPFKQTPVLSEWLSF